MTGTDVKLSHVTKYLSHRLILDDISLNCEHDKVHALCGSNGCGKTMLIRVIAGLIHPSSGECIFTRGGTEVSRKTVSIGAMIESPEYIEHLTGRKNLEFFASLSSRPVDQIDPLLEKVGLNPNDRRVFKKYSMGMRQKLGIAHAFLGFPDIILLDEPTNALDVEGVERLSHLIDEAKEHQSLVILSSHDQLSLANLPDIIHEMNNGKFIESHRVQSSEPPRRGLIES